MDWKMEANKENLAEMLLVCWQCWRIQKAIGQYSNGFEIPDSSETIIDIIGFPEEEDYSEENPNAYCRDYLWDIICEYPEFTNKETDRMNAMKVIQKLVAMCENSD